MADPGSPAPRYVMIERELLIALADEWMAEAQVTAETSRAYEHAQTLRHCSMALKSLAGADDRAPARQLDTAEKNDDVSR